MPIVSFWRDFHPDRTLSSTRPEFAGIINDLAHKDICRIDGWDKRTPAEIDKEIERINAWAERNASKTPAQLEWDALQEEIAAGAEWFRIRSRVNTLLQLNEPRAYDLMRQMLEKANTEPDTRHHILDMYRAHDVRRAKDLAVPYLADADAAVRLSAALVVFETGDKAKARPILADVVADGAGWAEATETLLRDDAPESRAALGRLAGNHRLIEDYDGKRPQLLARCAVTGRKEPYSYYLKLLETDGRQLSVRDASGREVRKIGYGIPVAEVFAAEVVKQFAPDDPAVKDIAKRFPEARDQVPHLRQWLRSRAGPKD